MATTGLMILTSMVQLSLAFLAFTLFMWVTMPWAFDESVDKKVEALKKNHASFSEQDYILPHEWLVNATNWYILSGICWMIFAILATGVAAGLYLPSYFEDLYFGLLFGSGATFVLLGMLRSHQVIMFVLRPNELESIKLFETQAKILAKGQGLAAISFFSITDIGFSIAFIFGGLFKGITEANALAYFQGLLFIAGSLSVFPILRLAFKDTTKVNKYDVWGPALAVTPFVYLLAVILAKAIGKV